MGEPKTRAGDASVAGFLAQQPGERREDCEAVSAMMQAATGEPARMWGGSIVGFGKYAYVSSGKTNEWPLVGFSPRKNELVLYLTAGFDDAGALLDKLGRHRTGKACLYVKRMADVDAQVLRRLIDASVEAMEAKRIR
ncbi:DUF1801 domain-containing protein [Thermomonas brevis]|uniref:DUF1801 domain-containing protein n=1 Tax=Thermomonas brevis TaxID=215691 RepID=A0A7G9QS32_9GAMM|nr:DUF1801 domain-containing protein [Thermomonas brevis]QNN46157.1 DUF1801 domain-containing protein [Thermomonas brevis]